MRGEMTRGVCVRGEMIRGVCVRGEMTRGVCEKRDDHTVQLPQECVCVCEERKVTTLLARFPDGYDVTVRHTTVNSL